VENCLANVAMDNDLPVEMAKLHLCKMFGCSVLERKWYYCHSLSMIFSGDLNPFLRYNVNPLKKEEKHTLPRGEPGKGQLGLPPPPPSPAGEKFLRLSICGIKITRIETSFEFSLLWLLTAAHYTTTEYIFSVSR
jgi:hypothetical protein